MGEMLVRHDFDVDLVDTMGSDNSIVKAARVSTVGAQSLNSESDRGLINYLMKNRHGSPFEHTSLTFYISAPIFVFREFQRHRIASYNEASGRYMELDPVVYVPPRDRALVQEGKAGHYYFTNGSDAQLEIVEREQRAACARAFEAYERQLDAGVAREVARMCLPLSVYSSMYVTVNTRSLMNFLSLRTVHPDSAYPSYPQYEIAVVAEAMEAYFRSLFPITWQSFNDNGRVAP